MGADEGAIPPHDDHGDHGDQDTLDTWIEVVGEDHIVAVVAMTRRGVADGTIVAFGEKESFLQHLTTRVDEHT